ncbi:MAG: hypothetical protein LBF68_08230 [Christensenellaceae bacterium]|jgi:hypothetical protein|nr:hypothetical protein [Christensenellaceae bacterium]
MNRVTHEIFKNALLSNELTSQNGYDKIYKELKEIENEFIFLEKENIRVIENCERKGAGK